MLEEHVRHLCRKITQSSGRVPETLGFSRVSFCPHGLGCVGFALLAGHEPFRINPSEEHQRTPLPAFVCSDSRLSSLIKMMTRKQQATRPSLERVLSLLSDMRSVPALAQSMAGQALAVAGAQVADRIQAEQAAEEVKRTQANVRRTIFDHAFDLLRQSINELWAKVELAAPIAQRQQVGARKLSCSLGLGAITFNLQSSNVLEKGLFRNSQWDMVGVAEMAVTQAGADTMWPSTLWFGKRPGTDDYRWYEILLWGPFNNRPGLINTTNPKDVDLALSHTMHSVAVAYGPQPIDDENENEFHERCQWLLARAANGHLRPPSSIPIISWPPSM